MAQPTEKHPLLEQFFKDALGIDRRESITTDVCAVCKKPATAFRDALSQKEYTISGLCQECQDGVFGIQEED